MQIRWDPIDLPLKRRIEIFVAGAFLHYSLLGELFFLISLTLLLVSISCVLEF